MNRAVFRLLIVLFSLLSGMTLVARALGETQPPNPAMAGFSQDCEGKPRPCFFGIVAGLTTEDEVFQQMAFASRPSIRFAVPERYTVVFALPEPWPYCYASFDMKNGVVMRGELSLCRQPIIRVGDVAAWLDDKTKVLSLPPEEMNYGLLSMNVEGWPSPYNRVTYITMHSPESQLQRYPWHGFVDEKHYCQLVPNYPICRSRPANS